MIQPETVVAAASSVVAITALLKVVTDTWSLPTKYNQLVALLIGAVWVPAVNLTLGGQSFDWSFIILGIMTGLSASGAHEVSSILADVVSGKAALKKFVTYKDPATGKFVKP